MKKSLLTFLLLMLLLISFGTAFAANDTLYTVDEFFEMYDKENEYELNKIKELLTPEKLELAIKAADDPNAEPDYKNAVKAYFFANVDDLAELYRTIGNLDSLISSQYNWIVPIVNSEKKHVCTIMIDGALTRIYGYYKVLTEIDDKENATKRDSLKRMLSEANIDKVEEIRYVGSYISNITCVYVKTPEQDYFYTFTYNPSKYMVENGKLYTAQEALDLTGKFFYVSFSVDDESDENNESNPGDADNTEKDKTIVTGKDINIAEDETQPLDSKSTKFNNIKKYLVWVFPAAIVIILIVSKIKSMMTG